MPVQSFTMKYESALVCIHEWNNGTATISNLFSGERRQGHATELMNLVTAWADAHQLDIQLRIERFGHPIGPDNDALRIFYEKFGFLPLVNEETGKKSDMMIRYSE